MFLEIFKTTVKSTLQKIGNRFITAVGRGASDEGNEAEILQCKDFQDYGFRSMAPVGTECATLSFGNNSWIVGKNDGNLPTSSGALNLSLLQDDVTLYHADGNSIILIGRQGSQNNENSNILIASDRPGTKQSGHSYILVEGDFGIGIQGNFVAINGRNISLAGGVCPVVYCAPGTKKITNINQLLVSTTAFVKP